ncbi:hypothetical protein FA13DRAFT_2014 [Coprinellus micaceus]|uniref:Uncharacterized protein n=1 Tax=Coprinellus micaceus TaxID=71717 RepID=A0A4Y7U0T6_COPMI|nr:hypothetical protein FA13DRAFT_2014 [Coprinellus micaceus]
MMHLSRTSDSVVGYAQHHLDGRRKPIDDILWFWKRCAGSLNAATGRRVTSAGATCFNCEPRMTECGATLPLMSSHSPFARQSSCLLQCHLNVQEKLDGYSNILLCQIEGVEEVSAKGHQCVDRGDHYSPTVFSRGEASYPWKTTYTRRA